MIVPDLHDVCAMHPSCFRFSKGLLGKSIEVVSKIVPPMTEGQTQLPKAEFIGLSCLFSVRARLDGHRRAKMHNITHKIVQATCS